MSFFFFFDFAYLLYSLANKLTVLE